MCFPLFVFLVVKKLLAFNVSSLRRHGSSVVMIVSFLGHTQTYIIIGLTPYLEPLYNQPTTTPIGIVSANSVECMESDLGCTSKIFFDNVTLT